ncbi:MAG: VOC family protein [Edaphobacter sp.]|uniref:VOC family protein n=1 Tax=Edaphobacter sp. TaxID=1934404 RepID=UPI00239E16E4|nr:VOC family protein [Edaphobacter sp.]MDE1177490.1 VOC family protein [Edaphobacter sp.]
MANPFVHMELNTPDQAKAKSFYGDLFGWTFEEMDMGPAGTYSTFKPDNGPGGGIFSIPDAPTAKAWLPYIGVENLKSATDKAISLGAKLLMRDQEVPGHGWFSILTDPTGATIALWESKK